MSIKTNTVKNLIKLYIHYKNIKVLSAKEYLEETSQVHIDADHFLKLTKHENFLSSIAKEFMKENLLTNLNIRHVIVTIYFVIFVVNDDSIDIFVDNIQQIKCFYLPNLLAFISDSNIHLYLCQIACKYFEDEYVLEYIIYPLLNRIPSLQKIAAEYRKRHAVKKNHTTVIQPFENLKMHTKKVPPPPATTPLRPYKFKAFKVPYKSYVSAKAIKRNIEMMHEKNHAQAEKLLQQAQKVNEKLSRSAKYVLKNREELPKAIFKSRPIPKFKSTDIKGNLTTTLREASRILKHQEEEVEKLNNLLKGGYGKEILERLEEEAKKQKEINELQKIEANHLKGLLSHEEAILAKKKCIEINKEKMEKFKEERVKLVEDFESWREAEKQKIQALVEKSNNIKYLAKESEKKLLEQKQQLVKLQQYETRKMLKQAYDEKLKDLERKTELIREIKTLHQVTNNIKEFDPTETPNLGLLCEMSIAELQERLLIMKTEMVRELEEKRKNILEQKKERRIMIDNVKALIDQSKQLQQTRITINEISVKKEDSPEIIILKQKLEEKRKLRLAST
ncbi:hypothetical protein GWI33_007029 [Rhynchophorus ferrugineus]|uniref:Cilia- and flagella-associated protein 99-like n=1 Tax=Rhynchophorus ferrugineus TaxID=354439 RepID=A0A834IKV6_RHYFE|nr:hypothetical protein GWI33_007029 [Rhynchophorus ferrugineus]